MAEKSWPYVSIGGDRKITASDEAEGYDLFVQSGAVPGIRDELAATKVSGTMQVKIAAGAAIIAGRRYVQDDDVTLTLSNGGAQARVDIIALESNANTPVREARFVVLEGAPALTQDASVYQQEYARVTVPANATTLNSATLTNTKVYASGRHSHDISDITGLQGSLNTLQTNINGKANTSHTHTIANVTNLQTNLNTLQTNINGKANAVHMHPISDIGTLQTTLNNKVNTSTFNTLTNVVDSHTIQIGKKQDSLDADQRRKITISTSQPSGGSNGDIWLVY